MKRTMTLAAVCLLAIGCTHAPKTAKKPEDNKPKMSDQGRIIEFPNDPKILDFFMTEMLSINDLSAEYSAPARIAATIVRSEESTSRNLVLFDNADLTVSYTNLLQHQININQIQNVNIKQKKIDLERYKDLAQHGAATQKDVLQAQTELAMAETDLQNEKAQIIEHEAILKQACFEPEALIHAPAGMVWLICDVPESQMNKLQPGNQCTIHFSSFPDESFVGKIESFGDVVESLTRMVKMRISLNNTNGQLKAGMFAMASFQLSEGKLLSVLNSAIVTVQGKDYVFVQTAANRFERRQVMTGQQINKRIIIYSGLRVGEKVVIKGAIQLKGLSFGY